jgi:thioredoxin-related protein
MGNILKQLEGVNIIEADIEDENTQELMAKYKVRTIPTIVIKNSESEEAEHTLTGVHSLEEIKSLLS